MRALLLAVALVLASCSAPKDIDPGLTQAGEIVLRAAIRHGVGDYLGRHPGSAARAKLLVDDLLLVLNGDATTTLDALKVVAYSKIPADFSPADQADAHDVIDLVALAVSKYIGDGKLNGQAVVDLRDVLGTISYTVAHYAPAG